MRASQFIIRGLLLLSLSGGASGCTLLGYFSGNALDNSNRAEAVVAAHVALGDLDAGDYVQCMLANDSLVEGIFAGVGIRSLDPSVELPSVAAGEDCPRRTRVYPGDTLLMTRRGREEEIIIFSSADRERLGYRPLGETAAKLLLYTHIEQLVRCGGTVIAQPYAARYDEGMFETVRYLRLATVDGVMRHFDTSGIVSIRYLRKPSTGRLVMSMIGLALDATIIVVSKNEAAETRRREAASSTHKCTSGCPIVYGWTGDSWALETESFTGSVFRAAERRDVARLERAIPDDGLIRLRVMNLLPEIDSINSLALLRVEHDARTEVYPTGDGHILGAAPQPPVEARCDRGRDVLSLVASADDEYWLATPAADARSWGKRRWMECVFPHPSGIDSATLVLEVRNTDWGAWLQQEFFSLFGSELQHWYDVWNSDAVARAGLHDAMQREAMLAVSVWDGRTWRPAGYVWEVGPVAPRTLAMRIGVSAVDGDQLRIRFEAPAGIWMLGRVGLDLQERSECEHVAISRLAAAEARGHDGTDRRAELVDSDESYLVLDTGERIDAAFRLPEGPHAPGRTVSWLFECSGYYRMKLHPTQPPRHDLLAKLLGERGFFARYADGLFWDSLTAMINDR